MYTIAEVQQHEELLESHRLSEFHTRLRRQRSAQFRRDSMRNAPSTVISYNKDADLRNFAHWGDDEKTRVSETPVLFPRYDRFAQIRADVAQRIQKMNKTHPASPRLAELRSMNQTFNYEVSRRNTQDTFHDRMSHAGF